MATQKSRRQDNEDSEFQEPPPPYPALVEEKALQSPQDEKETTSKVNDSTAVASADSGITLWQRFRRHFKGTPGSNPPPTAAMRITIKNPASPASLHQEPTPMWAGPSDLSQAVPATWHYTHIISVFCCPQEHHSEDTWRRSPWCAYFTLTFFGSEKVLPPQPSWPNNLDHCNRDVIGVANGLKGPGHRVYKRTISLHSLNNNLDLRWGVTIMLAHQDGQWLAGLTRREVADFVTMESAVRVFAWKASTPDPLGYPQLFHYKFLKPWFRDFTGRDFYRTQTVSYEEGLNMGLDVDEPRLRQLVDDNLEAIIQPPPDSS